MQAIILAAGVGQRLSAAHNGPKCLLEIDGSTLLSRHIDLLARYGVTHLTLVLGHLSETIVADLPADSPMSMLVHYNPLYRLGSSLSLWAARQTLCSGDDVLIMDADVLYHPGILKALITAPQANCFLLDQDFVDGEEPVKICLQGERIVEFRKHIASTVSYNRIGESVGFFKFGPDAALELCRLLAAFVADSRRDLPHEEVLRSLALYGRSSLSVCDVSGLPWIEIDFPEDIARATEEILPAIKSSL